MYSSKNKDLLKAIRDNDLRAFNDALQRGASVNASYDYGWSALHWASYKGNLTMCEILVDRGAKTNKKNNDKNTPKDICFYDAPPDLDERRKILAVLECTGSNSNGGETKS